MRRPNSNSTAYHGWNWVTRVQVRPQPCSDRWPTRGPPAADRSQPRTRSSSLASRCGVTQASGAGAAEWHARAIALATDRDDERKVRRTLDIEGPGVGEPHAQLVAAGQEDAHAACDRGSASPRLSQAIPAGWCHVGGTSIGNARPPARIKIGSLIRYG